MFQDRFRSEPVESDGYFITVLLYIYQNPMVAGLCKKIDEYEWCSRKRLGGGGSLIDEADLFDIVPFEAIIDQERDIVQCVLLEPKTGRRVAKSDEEAFAQMKDLGGVRSASEFQALGRETQASILMQLRGQGVSIRQFARLSGLGKGVVERLAKEESERGDA